MPAVFLVESNPNLIRQRSLNKIGEPKSRVILGMLGILRME